MKRIIFTLTIFIACVAWNTTLAETKETRAENPHELRIGVGDCSIYYAQRYSPRPGGYVDARKFDVLLPNMFVGYQYRVNNWFSAGVQVNTIWDKGSDYIFNDWVTDARILDFTEGWVHVIPSATFTYFHRDWVNLYSGIGVGYAMQLETKGKTRNIWHTFAAQATLLGVSVGKNHWFGSFEAGALFTGRSFPDRCFNFAVGYRF
ncbi:MAG: hypothetical protein II248_00945 [Paludibacteraceae bacterium]|nr:hypothetical protein [Paludibacteraceae bacterium]